MIFATRNDHKVRELAGLLPGTTINALPAEVELPPETGTTFEANALIKARSAREATGEAAIADDSGLEVDGLGGRPGVFSARYAGADATDAENLAKVLADLTAAAGEADGGEMPEGSARYVCVIALVDDSGEYLFRGTCEGRLIQEPRGERGFGYDPAFIPVATGPEDQRTMAELTADEKNAISHRGVAARLLAGHIDESRV